MPWWACGLKFHGILRVKAAAGTGHALVGMRIEILDSSTRTQEQRGHALVGMRIEMINTFGRYLEYAWVMPWWACGLKYAGEVPSSH